MRKRQDIILQDQFNYLIYKINSGDSDAAREITYEILYNSLCLFKNANVYLTILYKLIFHTYNHNNSIACHILNEFVRFGQSEFGTPYKPLLDYFVIEAFNGLVKMKGWSVIKPCVTVMHDNMSDNEEMHHYANEPLYNHILSCISNQLDQDINELSECSDLCFHLPREKSFTWGWFSYDIALTYYADLICNKKDINAKQMRNVMMLYRKLLTKLRKNGLIVVSLPSEPVEKIEENWNSILSALAEYEWASDVIKGSIEVVPIAEPVVAEPVVAEPIVAEPIVEEPVAEEPIVEEPIVEEPIVEEPIVEEPIVAEPIAEPEPQSWFTRLFRWS
jgi:hypothetical protein